MARGSKAAPAKGGQVFFSSSNKEEKKKRMTGKTRGGSENNRSQALLFCFFCVTTKGVWYIRLLYSRLVRGLIFGFILLTIAQSQPVKVWGHRAVSHLLGRYPEHSNLIRPFDNHLTQSSGLLSLQLTAQGKRLRLTNFHPQIFFSSIFISTCQNSTPVSVTQRWGKSKASLIFSGYYSGTFSWCGHLSNRFNLTNWTLHWVSPYTNQSPTKPFMRVHILVILDSCWKLMESQWHFVLWHH